MEDFGPSIALKTPNPPKLPRSAGKERERADGEKQRGMTEFRNVRPMSGKKARGTAFIPAELLSIYKTTIESMQHTINAEVFDRTYSPTKYDEKKNRSPDPFGVPKLPKPRTMGLVGVKDSEDLRQELFCTRDELNAVKQEKKLLLSRIHAIERSHDDMERRYQDQLIASTALRKQRYGGGGEKDPLLDDKIITKLKGALKNSEKQIKQKELEIEELKQSTRYRSLQKFEEEINRYYLEVVRLKRLLEHQETGTRLLDDDPERLLSYDDAISELCVKLTAEQDLNKELSDHNDRITTENERHRMNIDSLTCQLVELNGRHDELVSQHGLLVDSHNELNDKHQTLQNKFENKMMELEDTKKALSDLEERHREATIKIDGLEYLEAKHRENIETLSTQLKQTLESKSGIEAEFEHQKAGDRKKMEKLEEELKTFQDMAENLQHAIEKQEKAHTYQITEKDEALEREHATLASVRADLINLQQQSFDLQNVNVKLNYEISAARDRVSFLEKALLERNEQNRALENEVSQQKGMCKSFESQLAERNDKMGNLERRIATSEIEAKEIKTREAFLQQRVSSLVNDQIENHKKISDLQIELGGHGQEVNILQQALSSTDERLKTKQIEIQKYSENLQALHDSLTEHHERNVFLENAVSALDAQLAEKHGHVMQAQKIISSLEVRLSSVAANASHPVQFSENARSFSSYMNSYRNITGSEPVITRQYLPESHNYVHADESRSWRYDPVKHNAESAVGTETQSIAPSRETQSEEQESLVPEEPSGVKDLGSYPPLFSRSASSSNLVMAANEERSHSLHSKEISPQLLDNASSFDSANSIYGSRSSRIIGSTTSLPNEHTLSQIMTPEAEATKPPRPAVSADENLRFAHTPEYPLIESEPSLRRRGRQSSRSQSLKSQTNAVAHEGIIDFRRPRSNSISSKRSRNSSASLHRNPSKRMEQKLLRNGSEKSSRCNSVMATRIRSQSLSLPSDGHTFVTFQGGSTEAQGSAESILQQKTIPKSEIPSSGNMSIFDAEPFSKHFDGSKDTSEVSLKPTDQDTIAFSNLQSNPSLFSSRAILDFASEKLIAPLDESATVHFPSMGHHSTSSVSVFQSNLVKETPTSPSETKTGHHASNLSDKNGEKTLTDAPLALSQNRTSATSLGDPGGSAIFQSTSLTSDQDRVNISVSDVDRIKQQSIKKGKSSDSVGVVEMASPGDPEGNGESIILSSIKVISHSKNVKNDPGSQSVADNASGILGDSIQSLVPKSMNAGSTATPHSESHQTITHENVSVTSSSISNMLQSLQEGVNPPEMREDNELVDGRILDGAFQTEQALSRSSSPTSISVRSSSKNPLLQGLASSEIEFDIFGGSSSDIGSVSNRTRATIETKSIGSSIISINTIKVGNATKLGSLPQLLPTSETTSFKKSSLTSLKPLHASKHGIADYSSHEELPEGSVMRTVEDRGTTSIALQKEEVFRDSPNANTSALDSWKSKEHTQEFESMISVREVRDEIQTELSSSNPSVKMGARSTSENGLKNQQTISRTSSFSPRQSLHLDEEVNQDTYQNQLDQLRLSVEGERPRSTSLSKDLDDGSAQSELSNSPTSVHAVESTGKLGTSEHDDDGRRFPTTLRNEKQLYVKESNSNVTTGAEIEVDSSAEFSQSSFSCEDGEELSESTSESAGFSDHGTILEGIPSHVDLRAVGSSTSVMGSAVPSNADLLDSGRSMNPTMVENRYSKHELLDSTKPKSTSNIRETVGDDGNLQHKSPIHASQPFLQPAEAQDNTKKEYSGESAQLEQESNPGASVVRVSQAHEKSHEWLGLSSEPEFTSSETVATAVSPHDQPSNSSAVKPVESYQASPASSDAAPVANHHILPVAASAIPTSVVKHVEKDVNSDPNVVSQNATESGNESGTESETSSEYGSDEESEGSTISNVVGKSTDDFWADSASVASGGTASADELSEAW